MDKNWKNRLGYVQYQARYIWGNPIDSLRLSFFLLKIVLFKTEWNKIRGRVPIAKMDKHFCETITYPGFEGEPTGKEGYAVTPIRPDCRIARFKDI